MRGINYFQEHGTLVRNEKLVDVDSDTINQLAQKHITTLLVCVNTFEQKRVVPNETLIFFCCFYSKYSRERESKRDSIKPSVTITQTALEIGVKTVRYIEQYLTRQFLVVSSLKIHLKRVRNEFGYFVPEFLSPIFFPCKIKAIDYVNDMYITPSIESQTHCSTFLCSCRIFRRMCIRKF